MSKLEIPIDAKVLFQMYEYAAYADHHFEAEIAGWGHYNKEDGIYKLAPLLSQIVSGGEVNTFPDSILNDKKYDMSDMIVQWHSHIFMSTDPSAPDKELIKDALELWPALISIIVNCKHEYSARLDARRVGADHCAINLDDPITYDVVLVPYYSNDNVDKEVKKKLRKPKPKPAVVEKPKSAIAVVSSGGSLWDDIYPADSDWITGQYKATMEKATMLETDFPEEFMIYGFGEDGHIILNNQTLGHYCIITPQGVEVNGSMSTWRHFLKITGVEMCPKYHL